MTESDEGEAAASHATFACNLNAISVADSPRYNELGKRLRTTMMKPTETLDGYRFRLDYDKMSLREVAEWISMERLCCPFLTFQLETSGTEDEFSLRLGGPFGVKGLLQAEFLVTRP